MGKLIKVLYITPVLFLYFFVSQNAHSAACTITSASWGQSSAQVGDTVSAVITVGNPSDCQNQNIGIQIFEEDPGRDDPITANIPKTFTGTDSRVIFSYTFSNQDYADGGNESGSETIYFTALVQNQTAPPIESNRIPFRVGPGGVVIDDFNVTPGTISPPASNITYALRVSFPDQPCVNNVVYDDFVWEVGYFGQSGYETWASGVIGSNTTSPAIKSRTMPFSIPGGLDSVDFIARVGCGIGGFNTVTNQLSESSRVTLNVQSSSGVTVNLDVNPKTVQSRTADLDFDLSVNFGGVRCTGVVNPDLIWEVTYVDESGSPAPLRAGKISANASGVLSSNFTENFTLPSGLNSVNFKAAVGCGFFGAGPEAASSGIADQLAESSPVTVSLAGTAPAPGQPGQCGQPGQPECDFGRGSSFSFQIDNPLSGTAGNVLDILNLVATWIFNISIPIAVIMILYGGFLFLTAGAYPDAYTKGKKILTYTVAGLAIIFIGKGFITLIVSILELGTTSGTPPITQPAPGGGGPPPGSGQPGAGLLGNRCLADKDCSLEFVCNDSICQVPGGNTDGEYCLTGRNCVSGLVCDKTARTAVVDGQLLGFCAEPDFNP